MSTQFPIYEDEQVKIELDERSCKFDLDVTIKKLPDDLELPIFFTTLHRADESEIIDIAVKILGPLFYYNPDGKILEELTKRLKERGYT